MDEQNIWHVAVPNVSHGKFDFCKNKKQKENLLLSVWTMFRCTKHGSVVILVVSIFGQSDQLSVHIISLSLSPSSADI